MANQRPKNVWYCTISVGRSGVFFHHLDSNLDGITHLGVATIVSILDSIH